MTGILIWLLIGSVFTNILWISRYKRTLNDFYYWKKEKNKRYTDFQYMKGVFVGLLLGPLVLKFDIDENEEEVNEDSFGE